MNDNTENRDMNLENVEVKVNETLNTSLAEKLDDRTVYVARLEFISIGDSAEVRPNFFYSHEFADEYEGPFPSSFMALQDMGMLLRAMLHTPGSGMIPRDLPESDGPAINSLEDFEANNATKN